MNGILRAPRRLALTAISLLVAAASAVSFAESYRGLYVWAAHHGLRGVWAVAWPLQVDVFIAVGELALFVALADQWQRRSRLGAWTVTLAGLAVSVAGNVGHVVTGDAMSRVTAAVPPLAAAAALAVGLGVLKRVVAAHAKSGAGPKPQTGPGTVRRPAARQSGRSQRKQSGKRSGTAEQAEREFMPDLAAGTVPSLHAVRQRMGVGYERGRVLRDHLAAVAASNPTREDDQ